MKWLRVCACIVGLVTAAGPSTWLRAGAQVPDRVTVPITDPARPASVNLQLVDGDITVRGSNRRDIAVSVRGRAQSQRNQGGGLRRLGSPAFTIEEERNVLLVGAPRPDQATAFEIEVPSRTNLKIGTVSGEVVVEGVEGELEINNTNGPITLTRVGGSIVANTTNHHVKATVTSVSAQRPMAFTSLNGHVDVTFPASLKANLKLRSDHGEVASDFDITPLQSNVVIQDTRRDAGGRFRIEVNRIVYGAVNGGGPEIELRTFNGNVFVRRGQ
jgi:hypothetical protein